MSAVKKPTDLQTLLKSAWAGPVKVSSDPAAKNVGNMVLATEGQNPGEVLGLALDLGAKQICQADAGSLETEVQSSAAMLFRPALYLSCPVSLILDPTKASIQRENELTQVNIRFSHATHKTQLLEMVTDYVRKECKSQSLVAEVMLIVDEMFTNAIFNAPFVDAKTGDNPGISRMDSSVSLGNEQMAELLLGHDEERLVIACRDPFGSLEPKKLLQRIRDCWQQGVSATMKMGAGGAGIGSFMVFNACSSYYVGVEKHGMTVVAVTLHWKWSSKRRASATKNLHWFAN